MSLSWKKITLFYFFLFLFILGKSEDECVFEHLSTENGLSNGSVSVMMKDHLGFMWFATWDGINRYDGHTFKTFKQENSDGSSSASNRIAKMEEDAYGNIWVITYDLRAFRLNRLSERFEPVPGDQDGEVAANITNVYLAASGDVWLSSNNQGIYRVVTDTLTNQIQLTHLDDKIDPALPGNDILFAHEDLLRNLWINTGKGAIALKFDPAQGRYVKKSFSETEQNLFNQHRLTCYRETSSRIYFGTLDGKLLIYNKPNSNLQELDFKNKSSVTNVTNGRSGAIYIGTRTNGLFEYNTWTEDVTNHFIQPQIQHVLKMYPDHHGMIWIESSVAGISKINTRNGKFRHYEQTLDVNPDIRSGAQCGFMEDENETLWLTLKGGGFGYYDPTSDDLKYFYNKPGDPNSRFSNFVNCFYNDPSGVLWMSTYFKGIEKVSFIQKKFKFIQPATQSNFSIANEVRAMLEDSKGLLWVATKNQELFLLDKDDRVVKKFDQLGGHSIGRCYALLEDADGDIYVGTKGNGLFRLERENLFDFKVAHFVHDPDNPSSLSNNNIYSLLEDKQGRIWIGTYGGGVNLLVNNHFLNAGNVLKNYPREKANRVRHMAEDEKGNLWIGTTDGILFLNPKGKLPDNYTFQFYNEESGNTKGLLSNDVFWIYCDQNHNIWMAALGGGLAKLKNYPGNNQTLEFSALTKENGLPSDVIFTITSDQNGNLWMTTGNGISYYDPHKHLFRNYSEFDGIVNSGFSEGACVTRADGSICFGANNGLYRFHPELFNTGERKVNLVLTGFQLFGKEVVPGKDSPLKQSILDTHSIHLNYTQNVFGINWAGLDFQTGNQIQYDYMLEGFDPDWRFAGGQNQASYTKLPPGEYVFKVRYSNPELQELNHPVVLKIEISPPYWKTNWAYFIYLVLIIAAIEIARRVITTMIKLRNKVLIEKKLTEIKLNFFTNISHELRTPLTLILGPAKELKNKEKLSSDGQAHVGLIEQNAERLLRLVNQLLDFRKVQSNKMKLSQKEVNVVDFIRKVCRNFDEVATEKNIQFKIQSSEETIIASIDEEKMDSVVFNLLSNAFKFTPEKGAISVVVRESLEANKVQIEVKDTGVGVPKNQEESLFTVFSSYHRADQENYTGTGIGLALSRELVELHGGKLTYQPTKGGGATFCVELKSIPQKNKQQIVPIGQKRPGVNGKELVGVSRRTVRNKSRILIVEDNQELRMFLHMQLGDDFLVEGAANGKEGLQKAIELQPDIILSDVMMPVMDGIQLLEQIKNNFDTSHIPVVLLTAKSSVESKIEGLRYGADAYMTKPFNNEQLKAQLENLLHQRVLLRERYAREVNEDDRLQNIPITDPDAEFLERVREIIEENLTNPNFKLSIIYKQVGMGRSKFFDKLKGLTGLSPIDFVKEYRLNKAKSLLLSGKYNVGEASYQSGFTDASYFSKRFKERFGVSPSKVEKS